MGKKLWKVVMSIFAFCMLIAVTATSTKAADKQMKIHAIYLGEYNGDAILIESNGEYLLMDQGMNESYDKVKSYLKGLGVKKLSLYYSHFHGDHVGGLLDGEGFDKLTSDFTINKIYLPDKSIIKYVDKTWQYNKIEQVFTEKFPNANPATDIVYLNVGSTFKVGAANVSIIGPVNPEKFTYNPNEEEDVKGEDSYENNCSLVAMIKCGNTTYLSAADTKEEGEKALIKKYGSDLKADIFKMNHHGMPPANTTAFIDKVQPRFSFGSNGASTELTAYGDGTQVHRQTWTSRDACSKYGFTYMLGEEKKSLVIDIKNDVISLYRGSEKLNDAGWTKVYGADGVYEKYNYYYFDASGNPLTGVQKIDGKKYYLGTGGCREHGTYNIENGKKVYYGWSRNEDNTINRYYEEGTAVMATGFKWIENKYYYFNSKGILKLGDENWSPQEIDGKYYGIYTSGRIKVKEWSVVSEGKRYFGEKGVMATGWFKLDGKQYYADKKTGIVATGVTKIGDSRYIFSEYGNLYKNKWVTLGKDKYYVDKDGKVLTGFQTISKKLYYFEDNGKLVTGNKNWKKVKIGKYYYAIYTSGSICLSNWRSYDDGTCYFDAKGRMCTGWNKIKGKKYYLNPDTGYRAIGIANVDTDVYYFSNAGVLKTNTSVKIDGKKYKVDKNGKLKNLPSVSKTSINKLSAGSKKVTINWKRNKKVDGYVIYYSTKKDSGYEVAEVITKNKTTSYTMKKLKKGKTYYFKICSYKELGNAKVYSKLSSAKQVKVK